MNNEDIIFIGCAIWCIVAILSAVGSWIGRRLGEDREDVDPYDFQREKHLK